SLFSTHFYSHDTSPTDIYTLSLHDALPISIHINDHAITVVFIARIIGYIAVAIGIDSVTWCRVSVIFVRLDDFRQVHEINTWPYPYGNRQAYRLAGSKRTDSPQATGRIVHAHSVIANEEESIRQLILHHYSCRRAWASICQLNGESDQ